MRLRALAPALLAVAFSAAAAAAVWTWAWRTHAAREQRASAPVRADAIDVPGLAGEVALAGGARLSVRIARLHQDDVRQRFDAQSLRTRFSLVEGEPFQCQLTSLGTADGAGPRPEIALADVRVEDERGPALSVFRAPLTAAATMPVDPLAALLAPPVEALKTEKSVSILMWGRAPAGHARLVVAGAPDVDLGAVRLPTRDFDNTLARIDTKSARADATNASGDRR